MTRIASVLALALLAAVPLGAVAKTAASPSGVTCAAGDPVVWLNTETKVYHLPGSSYYGKTKHGKYVCASDATKSGAHAAKREAGAGAMSGSMSGAMSSGDTMSSATSGKKRHKKSSASPMPSPQSTM